VVVQGACIVGGAVAVAGLPKFDVFCCEGLDLAGRVDDAGSGGACADVDADVVVLWVVGSEYGVPVGRSGKGC
jgi:hypothetical protein